MSLPAFIAGDEEWFDDGGWRKGYHTEGTEAYGWHKDATLDLAPSGGFYYAQGWEYGWYEYGDVVYGPYYDDGGWGRGDLTYYGAWFEPMPSPYEYGEPWPLGEGWAIDRGGWNYGWHKSGWWDYGWHYESGWDYGWHSDGYKIDYGWYQFQGWERGWYQFGSWVFDWYYDYGGPGLGWVEGYGGTWFAQPPIYGAEYWFDTTPGSASIDLGGWNYGWHTVGSWFYGWHEERGWEYGWYENTQGWNLGWYWHIGSENGWYQAGGGWSWGWFYDYGGWGWGWNFGWQEHSWAGGIAGWEAPL